MKLKTVIIDDEPIALEKLKAYVAKTPSLELVAACSSAFEAMEWLASNNNADLIITDINMPDLNGLEFLDTLTVRPMVIFITAYSEYAVDSYKHSAVDYILKPYSLVDFQKAVNKALERFEKSKTTKVESSLFIKVDYRFVRVDIADIRYIKGYGEYLQIYMKDSDKPLVTLSSFAAIRQRLTPNFLQVHRSYIVNMDCVAQIERGRITMGCDEVIPLGDSYREAFNEYLASRTIGKTK